MARAALLGFVCASLFLISTAEPYEVSFKPHNGNDRTQGCVSDLPELPPVPSDFVLRQVQIYVRHGDRTPTHDLVEGDSRWGQGQCRQEPCPPGALTILGEEQAYALGSYLRKKYVEEKKFLSGEEKDLEQVEAFRSESKRTGETLKQVFNGLFPIITTNETKYSIPMSIIRPLIPNVKDCPNIMKLYWGARARWNSVHANADKQLPHVLSRALKSTGKETPHWFFDTEKDPFTSIIFFAPTAEYALRAYRCHGMEDPVPKEVSDHAGTVASYAFVDTYCRRGDVWQPAVSYLLGELINSIESGKKKMVWYGTHDSTICTLLAIFSPGDAEWPPYTSTLILEVYDKHDGEDGSLGQWVRVIYNNKVLLHDNAACGRRDDGLCLFSVFRGMLEPYMKKSSLCRSGSNLQGPGL